MMMMFGWGDAVRCLYGEAGWWVVWLWTVGWSDGGEDVGDNAYISDHEGTYWLASYRMITSWAGPGLYSVDVRNDQQLIRVYTNLWMKKCIDYTTDTNNRYQTSVINNGKANVCYTGLLRVLLKWDSITIKNDAETIELWLMSDSNVFVFIKQTERELTKWFMQRHRET